MQKHDSTACLLIRRSEMPYCTSVRHSNPLGLPRNPWGPEAPPYSAPCAIMPLQAGGPLQSLSNFALGSPMFQRGKQSRAAAKIFPSFETLRTWPGRVHSFQKPRERQADIGSHHAPRDMRPFQAPDLLHGDSAGRRPWTLDTQLPRKQPQSTRPTSWNAIIFSAPDLPCFRFLGGNQTRHELPA